MASIDKMIQWFKDREGKVTYSMSNRYGPNSYDCSSSVYYSLIAGGFLPTGSMGNTDSLFRLEGSLLIPIGRAEVKRGDIFVAGYKGGSAGSAGHTGVFLSNDTIIHCTYPKNGIATTPAKNWMGDYSGLPVYYYRLKGAENNYPAESFNKKVTITKADWTLWGDLEYKTKKGLTKLGTVYEAKKIFTVNANKYYELYVSGEFSGFLNVDGAKELKSTTTNDIYVSAISPNYKLWGNFFFNKELGNTGEYKKGLVYKAKYKYTLGNGDSYYSLYQGGEWKGYINVKAVQVCSPIAQNDMYITATTSTYAIWENLYWTSKLVEATKQGDVYKARYKYTIGNGHSYYSLYRGDNWKGYINSTGMRKMDSVLVNKKVKIDGSKTYNIWKDLYWSNSIGKSNEPKFSGKLFTAKYSYLLGDDTVYYSLYDGSTWIGYIGKGGTILQ
ncbi:hypothetical protein IGI37_003124 [Enterococcus sp. AZ194]|uniref:peptidoglycan amidohydrolase family protein n=1 Tax=Enterococcus sp. AZ194 TaxID=2774629 RepID=UPI003F270CE3